MKPKSLIFKDIFCLDSARQSRMFDIADNCIYLGTVKNSALPPVGEKVRFEVTVKQGPVKSIDGEGEVIKIFSDHFNDSVGLVIKVHNFEQDSAQGLAVWLRKTASRPFYFIS